MNKALSFTKSAVYVNFWHEQKINGRAYTKHLPIDPLRFHGGDYRETITNTMYDTLREISYER